MEKELTKEIYEKYLKDWRVGSESTRIIARNKNET
jgi:hypothetical protein